LHHHTQIGSIILTDGENRKKIAKSLERVEI